LGNNWDALIKAVTSKVPCVLTRNVFPFTRLEIDCVTLSHNDSKKLNTREGERESERECEGEKSGRGVITANTRQRNATRRAKMKHGAEIDLA